MLDVGADIHQISNTHPTILHSISQPEIGSYCRSCLSLAFQSPVAFIEQTDTVDADDSALDQESTFNFPGAAQGTGGADQASRCQPEFGAHATFLLCLGAAPPCGWLRRTPIVSCTELVLCLRSLVGRHNKSRSVSVRLEKSGGFLVSVLTGFLYPAKSLTSEKDVSQRFLAHGRTTRYTIRAMIYFS